MNEMIILRGLPGSGKSTLSKDIIRQINKKNTYTSNTIILSTDDYFMVGDIYVWEAHLLAASHAWNQRRVSVALNHNMIPIIDNTNTTYREIRPYLDLADAFECRVVLVIPNTVWAWNIDECHQRNCHNVPKESIKRMIDRFETNAHIIKLAMKDFPMLEVIDYCQWSKI